MLDFKDLRQDQQACIDHLYGSDGSFLVMRMGGGKTATILTALAELIADGHIRRAIVMAPPLVAHTVWPREPAKWSHLKHLTVEALDGTPHQRLRRLNESKADIITVSDGVAGWLTEWLSKIPADHPLLDALIYDEPKLKDPTGKIGKALQRVAGRIKVMWLLSGTPRPGGYEQLFVPIRVLSRGRVWPGSFDQWRRRNFEPLDFHGYNWRVHDFRAKELDRDMAPYMATAPEPPNAHASTLVTGDDLNVEVDLPAAARKAYADMERHLLAEVAAGLGDDPDEAAIVAALSQAVASSKLSQIAQGFLYDEGETVARLHDEKAKALAYLLDAAGGENVVITYNFRDDLDTIRRVIGRSRKVGVLGGGTSRAARLKTIDQWNEGRIEALILHPASAGHGVELQHGGRRFIWYCPIWSNEQYDQTLKRLDRPGQTRTVYSHQIVARKTVDEIKINRVQHRMDDQAAFISLLRGL